MNADPRLDRLGGDEHGDGILAVAMDRAEAATIAAALTAWLRAGKGDPADRDDDEHELATAGDSEISLDEDGCTALLERLCTEFGIDQISSADAERKPFHVIGDDEVILHEAASESEARRWVKGYIRDGFGGHSFIRLDRFGPEENEPIETWNNPEDDDERED